jgi:hypothetical protein
VWWTTQARDCLATWEEKIVFTCSLTRESEADEFDARGISFSLKEVRPPRLVSRVCRVCRAE